MNLIRSLFDAYKAKVNPVKYARALGVQIGEDVRLLNIKPADGTFGSEPYLVRIGNHVTVGGDVRFVTHDGGVWVFREAEPDIDVFGPIIIGNNVFIGYGAVILPNVTVGDDVVIGARSVVTKDIPSGSVVAGVPARVLKTRDEYYESIKTKKMHIRDLTAAQRREILMRKFGLDGNNPDQEIGQ